MVLLAGLAGGESVAAAEQKPPPQGDGKTEQAVMTKEKAIRLGEQFGIVVDEVDAEIQKELGLQRAEGVAVLEVIGGTMAEGAGIKVRSVIKEIDKVEIKTLADFGWALARATKQCNFTVGTYEPADPGDPVGWGVNFHFVGCKRD
ncbi:MAG: hypothetical protein FJ248_06070 [Nitrospira sp.]|nr:hypothetical protein [Nitrospira sp.]